MQQGKLIQALEEAGIRKNVKVMVGGGSVTEAYTKKIGVDSAVNLAFRLADAPE